MPGGRKNLKQGALEGRFELQAGQSIMRVVCLRGSNLIEVEGADGRPSTLCLLPAKFNKTLWVRKGSFVVVNDGEREKAFEAGSKVTGIICHVLFEDQIRALKTTSKWPYAFSDNEKQPSSDRENHAIMHETKQCSDCMVSHQFGDPSLDGNGEDSSEDEGLPPLETNQNRIAANIGFSVSSSSDEDEDSGEDSA